MLKNVLKKEKMTIYSEVNLHELTIYVQSFCEIFHGKEDEECETKWAEEFYYYRKQPCPCSNQEDQVAEDGENKEIVHHDKDEKKTVKKIRISLFLRWLQVRISEENNKVITKIILTTKSEESLLYVAAMTKEMQKIMTKESYKPHLKEKFLKNEQFTDENPYWPSRWYVHVKLPAPKEVPEVLWQLQHVERLDLSSGLKSFRVSLLEKLSCEIGRFKDLKYLDLGQLDLSELPISLQRCEKLEEIRLEANEFMTLPLFLLKLPNLKTLYRNGNPFTLTTLKKKAVIFIPEDETEFEENQQKTATCDSLKTLCLKSLSTQKVMQMNIETLNIPKHLKTALWEYFYLFHIFCDFCGSGGLIAGKAYECRIDLDEFCGCKIIPVSGYVCSNECAEKLAQELNKRNKEILELSVPVYYNEEYEEIRRKQIRRKQRVRGAVQRIRNFLVRSRSEVLVD